MTIQEILDLGKMGYTKADIEKMAGVDPKQEPKQEPKEEPKQEPKQDPKQEPKQATDPAKMREDLKPGSETREFLEDLQKTLNGFIADLQKQNIINSNNRTEQKESAEDILASIIAPPLRKGEKTK